MDFSKDLSLTFDKTKVVEEEEKQESLRNPLSYMYPTSSDADLPPKAAPTEGKKLKIKTSPCSSVSRKSQDSHGS